MKYIFSNSSLFTNSVHLQIVKNFIKKPEKIEEIETDAEKSILNKIVFY